MALVSSFHYSNLYNVLIPFLVHPESRLEIDKKETEAFLSRPVKKVEDLNQNLKKSYQKNFFNRSCFEHFKILKEKRRDKDNDSIASEEDEDSQFMLSQSRSLRGSSRSLNNTERHPPQIKAHKRQKKDMSRVEENYHDHENQIFSENSSQDQNESCSDLSDSQISGEDTNSAKSQEPQSIPQKKTAKQRNRYQRQFQRQQDSSKRKITVGKKRKQPSKVSASKQQNSIVSTVERITQAKSVKKQQIAPAYLSRGKRTRLSAHIQKALDAKHNCLLELFESTEDKPQEEKVQEKIEIKQQATRTFQPQPTDIAKRRERKQLEPITIKPSTGNNNLTLNSKVIVESVLICSSYAKPQANQQHLSWLNHHFQHASCCSHRKKTIFEKEQCEEEILKRQEMSELARKASTQRQ